MKINKKMRINKKINQKEVEIFMRNKYIKRFYIEDAVHWIDSNNHLKGIEEVYEYIEIETDINSKNDLDIFMEDFLNSPLKMLNVYIKHNIKHSYMTDTYAVIEVTQKSGSSIKIEYDLNY